MMQHYTYRVTWSEEDDEHVATVAEFPSLSWLDQDGVVALRGLQRLVEDVVADMEARGEVVPAAIADRSFSGKFQVRITPQLHRHLVTEAAEQGVSLNHLVTTKLAMTPMTGACHSSPQAVALLQVDALAASLAAAPVGSHWATEDPRRRPCGEVAEHLSPSRS